MPSTIKKTLVSVIIIGLGAASTAAQIRELTFPEGMTGTVYLAQPPEREDGFLNFSFDDNKRIGLARGTIRVPAKFPIRLDIALTSPDELTFLSELPPDSIQQLLIRSHNTTFDQSALQHIASQGSLQYLYLRGKFTDSAFEDVPPLSELLELQIHQNRTIPPQPEFDDAHLAQWIARATKLESFYTRPPFAANKYKQLRGHPGLRFVHIRLDENCEELISHLHKLPNLGGVNVDVKTTFDTFSAIRKLNWPVRLEGFNWTGGKLDRQLLHSFSVLEKLQFLRFHDVIVAEDFEQGLLELKQLKRLSISPKNRQGLRAAIPALSRVLIQMPNLHDWPELVGIDAATLRTIAQNPQIERLKISETAEDVEPDDLMQLRQLSALRVLELSDVPLDDEGLQSLSDTKQLESLRLDRTNITGIGFKSLRELANLKQLSIGYSDNIEPTLKELGTLPHLRRLHLSGERLLPEHFANLEKCQQLSHLLIFRGVVDDSTAAVVGQLRHLEFLVIQSRKGPQITDRGLKSISQLSQLQFLSLNGQFTPKGVTALAEMPSLRSIYLTPSEATGEDVEQMREALQSISNVRIIQRGQ